jgi:predicted ATPase
MKYKSFYIKNYKGINELTIELDKDPMSNIITLVGLNESGKTTILEAISIFSNPPKLTEIHKLIPKNRKFNFTDSIEVHATLELDEADERMISDYARTIGFKYINPIHLFTQKIIFEFKDSELQKPRVNCDFNLTGLAERLRADRFYNPSSREYKNIQSYVVKNLIPSIIYYPNFLFNFPDRIYLEESEFEDIEQKTYRAVLSDIIDTLHEGINLEDHIVKRIKRDDLGLSEALESTLERISIQITKVVFTAWGQLFNSRGKEIRLKSGIDPLNDLTYLEVRLKEGSEQYQISERSLGFKWFFTFLLFTEFRKNRSNEKGEILFLLDEPASNLHSTAQKNLLVTFEHLVSNCKMIYTTHSHHLINPKWLCGVYIVKNNAMNYEDELNYQSDKADIEATIYKQFVVNHPEQKTYFQPILDAIEYAPSHLEEVPNIILTEGKNDYYTFKYVNEVIFKNEYPDVKFYPGNGADRNNQIIATYLAWGKDFTILLDGDKAGLDAKKRYMNEFGVVVEGKIITLKDIDSSYSYPTENLFTEEEQIEIINGFDPSEKKFHKSKFNTALQNLFIQEEIIELSEVTVDKFRKVFEFIR